MESCHTWHEEAQDTTKGNVKLSTQCFSTSVYPQEYTDAEK